MPQTISGIAVIQGDKATLSVASLTAGIYRLSIDLLHYDGEVTTEYTTVTQTGTETFQTSDVEFSRTAIIVAASIERIDGSLPTSSGQTYASAWVRRGGSGIATLFAGYLVRTATLGYPQGVEMNMDDGKGTQTTASGTVPAVATDISDIVPASQTWLLFAIEAVLVTDANAANRTVNLFIDDAQATITRRLLLTDTTAQTATLTRTHGWYPGTDNDSTASVSVVDTVTILAKYPMSLQNGILLRGGSKLRTQTTSIQAGDQWGAARYWIQRWITAGSG
jgi:hypothetical protein